MTQSVDLCACKTSLIAGNPRRVTNHNVIRKDGREGLKIVTHVATSSQVSLWEEGSTTSRKTYLLSGRETGRALMGRDMVSTSSES